MSRNSAKPNPCRGIALLLALVALSLLSITAVGVLRAATNASVSATIANEQGVARARDQPGQQAGGNGRGRPRGSDHLGRLGQHHLHDLRRSAKGR